MDTPRDERTRPDRDSYNKKRFGFGSLSSGSSLLCSLLLFACGSESPTETRETVAALGSAQTAVPASTNPCGDTSGLAPSAWPALGRCPTRMGRSDAKG